jgi:hypothetical protein
MVAGVNRRAGSTGDSGTGVRNGKAARALPVPSDNRRTPERTPATAPRLLRADADNENPLAVGLFRWRVSRLKR